MFSLSGINSPVKFESITDIIHSKIEETGGRFLIGEEEKREAPNWSTLFDGSQPIVIQKSVLSPSKSSTPRSSPAPSAGSNKKRRAPPPPSDRQAYTPPSRPARPPLPPSLCRPPPPPTSYQEKENSGVRTSSRPAARSKTGRPSLDAKFSAIIQQLQRNGGSAAGPSRKNAPLGHLDIPPQQSQDLDYQVQHSQTPEAASQTGYLKPALGFGPVPAPRSKLRKSFREKMNPKAW